MDPQFLPPPHWILSSAHTVDPQFHTYTPHTHTLWMKHTVTLVFLMLHTPQGSQSRNQLLLSQARELTVNAASIPSRIAKMDSTLAQLESGDLKIRVRVLEAERAARRAQIMQVGARAGGRSRCGH